MITTTRKKAKKASEMIDYHWFDKAAYSNACVNYIEVANIKDTFEMEKRQISDAKVIEELQTVERDGALAGDKLTDVRPASRVSELSLVASTSRRTLPTGNAYSTDMKRQAMRIGINGCLCMILFGLIDALYKRMISLYVFNAH